MNFCGVDHQHVLDIEMASTIPASAAVAGNFQCGGCVKVDDDEFFAANSRLSAIATDSSDDDDEEEEEADVEEGNANGIVASTQKQPVKSALDNIQQTLEDINGERNALSTITVGPLSTPSRSAKTTTPTSPRKQAPGHTSSPSPNLLNPLTTDWKGMPKMREITSSKLLCPILDITSKSPSLDALMQRLEEGFRVRLTGGPISCLAGEDYVCLYLHDDRSRLCFDSNVLPKQCRGSDQKKGEGCCWIELLVADILRLEIGGSNKNSKSFSIVLEKERGCLVYYDFETTSAIEREVVVTALMILLDKTHNSEYENHEDAFDWTGGTMDQPIPCSPSLDHPIGFSSSLEQPIVCSPSLEQDRLRGSLQLSPRRRTHIFNSADNAETETSLVIHLDDFSISESNISRRELPTVSLQQKSTGSDEPEDVRLDFKPSASSTQLTICANNSTNLGATAWCSADSCALALNDIADTCTGIFALKQGDATCAPSLGKEQRVVVEEFIATALGAPTAMYTYLTEGDIWNIESSVSTQQPKETTVTRNRASLLNAQAARLRGLRNEMTFAAALKQSKERMYFVQTVQSFDDAYTRSGGTKKLRAATEAANRFHSSPLLQSIVGSMTLHDPNGYSKEDEVVYYDSDPEDSRTRTARKGPRQIAADRLNHPSETKDGHHHRALSGVGFEDIGTSKKLSRKLDEETIVEIVHVSPILLVSLTDKFFSLTNLDGYTGDEQ
jgi:hypothetical protein